MVVERFAKDDADVDVRYVVVVRVDNAVLVLLELAKLDEAAMLAVLV
jgi:hypothetical protein